LRKCYGNSSKEDEDVVKIIFKQLDLERKFREYEEKIYHEVIIEIKLLQEKYNLPTIIFQTILDKIYMRKK